MWTPCRFFNYDLIFVSGPSATQAYGHASHLTDWIQGESDNATRTVDAATDERASSRRDVISLEDQLRWLREGGFQEVECFWKEGHSAIIGGFRPL